jgi:queuine tRNA-ribosyltransferase
MHSRREEGDCKDWRSYVLTMQPDIAFALSDTPFTAAPHSQKRLTKSIERSAA